MNPLIKLIRANGTHWEERRFFGLFPVRVVTGWKAIELDIAYLRYYKTFPSTGDVCYAPSTVLLA